MKGQGTQDFDAEKKNIGNSLGSEMGTRGRPIIGGRSTRKMPDMVELTEPS